MSHRIEIITGGGVDEGLSFVPLVQLVDELDDALVGEEEDGSAGQPNAKGQGDGEAGGSTSSSRWGRLGPRFIREGYCKELDEAREMVEDTKSVLANLQVC